jgi:hypothetical protein
MYDFITPISTSESYRDDSVVAEMKDGMNNMSALYTPEMFTIK